MPQAPFVGREQELQLFRAFLQQEKLWVLIIVGMGGCGKSTLLRHLATDVATDIPSASLDFGNEQFPKDSLSILEALATQLVTYAHEEQQDSFQETLQHGRDTLARLHRELDQKISTSEGAYSLIMKTGERATREVQLQIRARVTASFYDLVDSFRADRLLLMFDTCEWLVEPQYSEVSQWLLNELIPEIHLRLQSRNRRCFVVIASRMQLSLEVVHRTEQQCIPLELLNRDGVSQYLQHIGMSDPQLHERINALTHGHPLGMSIIAGLWQERGEQPFDLTDFPALEKEFNQQALLLFIQARLEAHLSSPYRELTHYGVLLRSFTLPMLRAVFPEQMPADDALEIFHRLIDYPYVVYVNSQRYIFHETLRDISVAHVRDDEQQMWQLYHERALDYLTQVAPYSPDWYYHALACREEETMSSWLQVGQIRQRERLEALLKVVDDKTLKLTPRSQARRAHQRGYFYYHEMKIDDALHYYQTALQLYREIKDALGEANVLQAIGDVQGFRKEIPAALELYKQALGLYQQVGDSLGEANVRKAIGDVQQFRDEQEEALASYKQALSLYQQVGDRLGEATVRKAIGDIQRVRDEQEEALASYKQALGLYQQVSANLGEANVRKAIGDVQQFRDEQEEALASYEQARDIYKQVGDRLGEANVLQAIGDVQQFRKEMQAALDSYEQALDLFQQVGDRLGEANARKALGDVQCFNDTSAAMESYEQAETLYRHIGSLLGEANCYFAKGQLAWIQDEYDVALEDYAMAQRIYQKLDDADSQAHLLYCRSLVYEARDDWQDALEDMAQSVQIAQRLQLPYIEFFQQRLDELQAVPLE